MYFNIFINSISEQFHEKLLLKMKFLLKTINIFIITTLFITQIKLLKILKYLII